MSLIHFSKLNINRARFNRNLIKKNEICKSGKKQSEETGHKQHFYHSPALYNYAIEKVTVGHKKC